MNVRITTMSREIRSIMIKLKNVNMYKDKFIVITKKKNKHVAMETNND